MRKHECALFQAPTLHHCLYVTHSCRLGDDGFTCLQGQQMGFFDVKDPSECDKPKNTDTEEHSSPADFLAHGALVCCKSQEVDQSVCKVDKCVSGMMKCMHSHGPKFEAIENQLTDPKAMDTNDDGELEGSCPTAIMNRVEGALCCTDEMEQMIACVSSEVGDYTVCKDTWKKAFEPDFFVKAAAVINSYKPGGYCAFIHQTPGVDTTSGCSKCATFKKSGKRSCCAPGGAWSGTCGSPGDSKFDHTWGEGVEACKGNHIHADLGISFSVYPPWCLSLYPHILHFRCVCVYRHSSNHGASDVCQVRRLQIR